MSNLTSTRFNDTLNFLTQGLERSLQTPTQLLVIDAGVEDHSTLAHNVNDATQVLILDSEQNGILQISQILQANPAIATLHIIAHGTPGCIHLGNTPLNRSTLTHHQWELSTWFSRARNPQIYLYSCNVALGYSGIEFVETLHRFTKASIAASTQLIGRTASGCNWQLNYQIGTVDVPNPIAPEVLQSYQGVLAPPTITDALTTTRTTAEDTALSISGITIADPDSPSQTVTVGVTTGAIALAGGSGVTVTGSTASSITFTGTIAQVNAALNGMTYTPLLNDSGAETLTITTNDGGGSVTKAIALDITPVNDAPTIAPTATSVAEGSNVTFTAASFNLLDIDNVPAQVIVKISSLPGKGYLSLNGGKLAIGSTFSSDQIPQLKYFHDGTQTTAVGGTSDSFIVDINDGAGGVKTNTAIPLTITPVNQLPTVTGIATLFEGETNKPVSITFSDPDQAVGAAYTIKILSLPADGTLKLGGTAVTIGQTFSSTALNTLTFSHDGNDAFSGFPPNTSFNVEVRDDGGGTGTPGATTATVNLVIKPNDDDPILVNNSGVTIDTSVGLQKTITASDLQVTDPDSANTQIAYTLTQAVDPAKGSLQLNGNKLGVGATFTQDDINSGRLKYVFNQTTSGPALITDTFKFVVRDSELREFPSVREGGIYLADDVTLKVHTFNITVNPVVPVTQIGSNAPNQTGSATPTIVTNTGIVNPMGNPILLEGGSVVVTNAMLKTTDIDNTNAQLVYRLEQAPTSGTFRLNGTAIGLYGSFTQDDIDQGRVRFQHFGDEDFIDFANFSVSDGVNVVLGRFDIDVIPQNDAPVITVGNTVALAEGAQQIITPAHFSLSDVDGTGEKVNDGYATPNSLTFKVVGSLPVNGDLFFDPGSGFVQITAANANSFTLTSADVSAGKLKYIHRGDENVADSFQIQANDNTSSTSNNLSAIQTIAIEIASLNDAPSFVSKKKLIVQEAGTGLIKGDDGRGADLVDPSDDLPHLYYSDPDNTTVQRQYRITTATQYGKILKSGKALAVGSIFTQEELDTGKIQYLHNGSENYTDQFKFVVSDGDKTTLENTYDIEITPTDDAPTLTIPGAIQTFATLTPLVFSAANGNRITFDDPDLTVISPGETDIIQVTLDLQASGATYLNSTLTLGSTAGITVTTGASGTPGGIITFKGTKANVQAALDGMNVQVPGDEDRSLSLVVTVNDLLNGGPYPLDPSSTGLTVSKTIAINASNVNDAPTIAKPTSVIATEDTAFSFTGGNLISVADVDTFNSSNNVVTLSVTKGTLNVGTAGVTVTGNNSGTVTVTGSIAAINTAIAALKYTGNLDFNGSDTLTIQVDDKGNLGTGGAQIVTTTVPITVTPVNDTPTLTAPSTTLAIEDGNPLTFSGGTLISIDDSKDLPPTSNGNDTFIVVVDALNGATPYGTVNATTGSGATITNNGTASVTISGTKAQVNAALNGLSYTPADSNVDMTITLKVTVNDQANGGTAIGGTGGASTVTKDIPINVSGINDAPTAAAPASITATEDTDYVFAANVLQVADPDDFGKPIQVQLTVAQGKLTLGSTTNITFIGGTTNNAATMTIQGTEANIQAALNGLKYRANLHYNNTAATKDTLSILVNDLGNSGTGGAKTASKVVDIIVNPQNDAPIASGSATIAAILEDTTAPTGNNIGTLLASNYSDAIDTVTGGSAATPLAGIAVIANAATAAQGVWQHFNGTTWIAIPITGLSNTTAFVISASDDLRFVPTTNFNGTPGSLTVRLSDGTSFSAGSGKNVSTNGGTSGWSAATVAIGTSITAVNDAPIASGAAVLTAVNEDNTNPVGDTVTNLFTPRFSDSTDQVTGGSTANTLAGIAIVSNTANPTTEGKWQYFNGAWVDVGTRSTSSALLVTAADKLRFLPVANFNGTPPGLTVNLIDSSGGAVTSGAIADLSGAGATGGTTAISSNAISLTTSITAVNDVPLFTKGADQTVNEDAGSQTVSGWATGISAGPTDESGQTLTFVATNNNNALFSTQPTIDATGKLVYTPAANANGVAIVTVSIKDNGGTANGGVDTSATQTFTITVNPVPDSPNGADKTITTNEDTSYTLKTIDFGFTDPDTGDTLSAVRIDTLPTNGTLKLNGVLVTAGQEITAADITANTLVFTPATDANGLNYANFTFSVKDSSGDLPTQFDPAPNTITFNVTAINDPPSGADKTVTTNEDTGYTFTPGDFGFSDPDGHTFTDVRIDSLPASGTLKLNGITVTANQVITVADVTSGKLVYTPAANANGTAYANFNFSVKDSSSAFDSSPNKITVNVTAVNDPPTGQDKTITAIEDTGYTLVTADFGFADVDGDTLSSVRIDTLPTNGTLKLNGTPVTAGLEVSVADIVAGKLVFTAAPDANGANYANFNFSVKDSSGIPATEFDLAPNKITFNVTAKNDPPTGQDKTIAAIEDTGYALTVADFGFADIDAGDTLSGVRLDTLPANGTLTLNGAAVTAGQTITATDITAGKLVFTAAPNANGTNYANFTFSVKDSSGDVATQFDLAPNTITFDVTAKNDPPTGQDKTIVAIEDTGYVFTVADFGFADIDAGDTLSGVRIDTLPAGTLNLNGVSVTIGQTIATADITAGKLIFTPAANANGNNYANFDFSVKDSSGDALTQFDLAPNRITFNVTPTNDPPTGQDKTIAAIEDTSYILTTADFGFADVDTGDTLSGVRIDTLPTNGTLTLNGSPITAGQIITAADITAGKLAFTAAADANGTNYTSFTFSVRDSSGIAATEFDTLPNTLTFDVAAKNDPPTGQDKTITAIEDTGYALTSSDFGFSDIDPGDTLSGVRIDTLPTNGTLKLNGTTILLGQFVTVADINGGKLVFTSALNGNGNNYANFTFSVKDSSGDASTDFDLAPNTITFDVTPVNDPPTGQDNAIATPEDTNVIFAPTDFGFSDIDGDILSGVRIDTLPANGTLQISGVNVTAGQIISAADLAAGKLIFVPVANSNGVVNFTFSVRDNSGALGTDFDLAPNTLTISIGAVNDPPTGQDKAIALNEDASYTLAAADFGFSDLDPLDTLAAVRIDTLPTSGILKLNGVAVTAGQEIDVADIGNLVFTPAANANGSPYANFTFSVKDSSGFAATEFDVAPNTITFNVAPVNDPPTGADKTIVTVEDTGYAFTPNDFGFSDIDPSDVLSGVRIDSLPTSGTLKLNGVAVTLGQTIDATDIAAGKLVFTPALNSHGNNNDSFTFSVKDSSGDSLTDTDLVPNTITVNVTPTNDPPTGQDKTLTLLEDTGYIFTSSDFGFSDIDPGDTFSGIRIDTLPAGTFKLNGVAVTIGQVISATDINSGKLIFTPASNSNGNNHASFTFSVRDSSGEATTEFDLVPNTITVNVTPANDPPTGSDRTIATLEDTGYSLKVTDFGFNDIDGDSLAGVRIDTLPHGTLKLNGVLVTAGQIITAADITAGNLVFTPALNATSSDTFTFSVQDSSGDILTQFDAFPNTLTFTITPTNDPPTGQDKTIPTVAGTPYAFTPADFGFNDIDGDTFSGVRIDTLPPSGTFALNGTPIAPGQVISAADLAAGKLVFTPASNPPSSNAFTFSVQDSSGSPNSFDPVPNTINLSASLTNDPPTGQNKTITTVEDTSYPLTPDDFGFSDIDPGDVLSGVRIDTLPSGTLKLNGIPVTAGQVISATDLAAGKLVFTPVANLNGDDRFSFSVRDSSGDAATEFDTTPNVITFNVTPVNDPPTGQDKAIATAQNTSITFTPSDFGFSDVDPGDALSGVRLDTLPTNGSLTLNGVSVSLGQVISAADLAAGKLVFTPALNASGLNYANFNFSVKDSSGSPSAFDLVPNTIAISVGFTNTAPTGQDKTITTPENTGYGLTPGDFGFNDPDAGDTLSGVRLDTLPSNGMLTLNGAPVTIGQLISATDLAAGKLVFTPAPGASGNNYTNFTFSVRDSSGDLATQYDTVPNTVTFNVTDTNAAPNGQDKAIATPEDTARPFTPADFGFSDPDPGDTLSAVRIDTLPTGTLTLNGTSVTPGQIISLADIPNLVFTPATNANGSTSLTFSVQDSGSPSEFDPTPNQITFNVTPVKDAPTGQDKTIAATGGVGYALVPADFGFADVDNDSFSAVRIDTLPANGTFQFNGASVTLGQVISVADLTAGKLVFTVAPGTNGTNYANFTFSVKDNSGDTPTEFDTVPNTITFDVASNLPPAIDLDGDNSSGSPGNDYQVLYTPGQLAKMGDVDVKITDIDDLNMESATLILTTRPNGSAESLVTGALPTGITASAYDPLTGVLKLTGSASIAAYQNAIASITYKNTAVAKDRSNRIVTVVVNDGEKDSNIATTTLLFDTDGDRSPDSIDLDDDNDGIPDAIEQNGDPNRDTDGDGIIDSLDLDSDNDGILDIQESGLSISILIALDKDNDGVIDPTNTFGNNGLANPLETSLENGVLIYSIVDTDGDKRPNFQDLDSDNDGFSDLVESGFGFPDGNGDKMVDGTDSDGDGILDPADKGTGFGGGTRPPLKDANNNGIPDFMEISVSRAKGSNGSDTIIGTDDDDILNGFSDLDIIYGRGGNDLINGGSDRDILRGDEGNDTINGGTGNDDIQGGTGNDSISGGDGDDLIFGNDGDDVLNGDRGRDKIYGGKGKDIINGSDGNDRLYGDEDDDIVRGDRGNDLIVGGLGKDELTGGQGKDTFKYRSVKEFGDVITDFEIVKDRLDLRKIFNRRGSMSNIDLQQRGQDTIVNVDFRGRDYTLGTLEDVNANTLKARHFRF